MIPEPTVTGATKRRHIVLFSDGTGNSSAKLFKTNVWRMYEAVDLGAAAPDRRRTDLYYDDGVGTSGFKPLAVLGGVFGYGLKRNVLDIYKYACRNYEEGDDIYAFGFSRGAFTTRARRPDCARGLVQSRHEGELDHLTKTRIASSAAPAAAAAGCTGQPRQVPPGPRRSIKMVAQDDGAAAT